MCSHYCTEALASDIILWYLSKTRNIRVLSVSSYCILHMSKWGVIPATVRHPTEARGVYSSVYSYRVVFFTVPPKVPDPLEILTLRTFLKGFTCYLTLSHFLGGTVKKTTLYIHNYKKTVIFSRFYKKLGPDFLLKNDQI